MRTTAAKAPLVSLAAGVLIACGGADARDPAAAQASPTTTAAADEAPVTSDADGADPAETTTAGAQVDLLRAVPAQVVVSSAASAGMSGASRMVDGRMDTAWNSATDDLVGAWVMFVVPEDARVRSIRLVPGYARNPQGAEVFTQNHRIRRVAIFREGQLVGEHTLDPARPELQTLDVEGAGGRWRIEVREVVPGSRREWRETTITELEVWGIPGAAHRDEPGPPQARVGTVAGTGAPVVPSGEGAARRTELPALEEYAYVAIGALSDEEQRLADLVRGAHVGALRPRMVLERSSGAGRALWVLYFVDVQDEARTRRRMRRGEARRGPGDEPCDEVEEEPLCNELWLARVSVARGQVPVVEGAVRVAEDVCQEQTRMALRDLDEDGADEIYVRTSWFTHPVCGPGRTENERELIADADDLREQLGVLLRNEIGAACGNHMTGHRIARDLNGDGRRDYLVRYRAVDGCLEGSDAPARVEHLEERWIYDPAADLWRLQETEDQP